VLLRPKLCAFCFKVSALRLCLSKNKVLNSYSVFFIELLYGKQEGATKSYNPQNPGRPSHAYHSYFMGNTRLALGVEVESGDKHTGKHP
jgi:hypothetical protein